MKLKWSKKYASMGLTAFLVVAASILLLLLLLKFNVVLNGIGMLFSILMPIVLGFAFAYLLSPVLIFFETKCFRPLFKKALAKRPDSKLPRIFGIIVTILLAVLAIIGLLSIILPQLIQSIQGLVQKMPAYLEVVKNWVNQTLTDNEWLASIAGEDFDSLIAGMQTRIEGFLPALDEMIGNVTGFLIGGAIGVVNTVTDILVGLVVSIYVMFSKEKFAAQIKKTLYALFPRRHIARVLRITRDTNRVFGGFVSGKLLDSLIIGVLTFIVLTIVQMPYSVLISVVVGVTNIIPFFGPFIGAIPSALILLLEDPLKAILFVVIILIIQQIDGNLIGPKILGDSTGLSAFWVIFAILLGGGLFGFVGMLLGVPTFAVIYSLFKAFVEERLRHKNIPSDTGYYIGTDLPPEEGEAVAKTIEEEAAE